MITLGAIVRFVATFCVLWLVDALSLGLASAVLPGITFTAVDGTSRWIVIIAAALLLAIVATLLLGMGSIWIWEFVAPGALGTGGGA